MGKLSSIKSTKGNAPKLTNLNIRIGEYDFSVSKVKGVNGAFLVYPKSRT